MPESKIRCEAVDEHGRDVCPEFSYCKWNHAGYPETGKRLCFSHYRRVYRRHKGEVKNGAGANTAIRPTEKLVELDHPRVPQYVADHLKYVAEVLNISGYELQRQILTGWVDSHKHGGGLFDPAPNSENVAIAKG